jgi:hypothetical protein
MKFDFNSEYKTGNITINIVGEGGIKVQRSDLFIDNTFVYKCFTKQKEQNPKKEVDKNQNKTKL